MIMKCVFIIICLLGFSLSAQIDGDENLEVTILAQEINSGMEMSITSDGRIFIAEREGTVKLYDPKTNQTKVVLQLETHLDKEAGFMGICIDPNFDKNSWVYLYHTLPPTADDPGHHNHVLGRFEYKEGLLQKESEKVLLTVRAAYKPGRIHEAGSIAFDADGLLYLSTGDNQIRSEYLFSCKTSANTNDLRGKILRIKPEEDGTYTIPKGNLFPVGTAKTKPEIYIMGLRNPFRISIDKQTGWLLWGENGPPNKWVPGTNIPQGMTPDGYDEFNLAKKAGFYGYPLVIADQQAFTNYDYTARQPKAKFNPDKPINDHLGNTGLKELPPSQKPLIWYEGVQDEFPQLGGGGESAIAGPIFRRKSSYLINESLPKKYDNSWIIGEFVRGWIKAVKLDEQGNIKDILPILPSVTFGQPVNIKIGPKGRIHVLYFLKKKKGLIGGAGFLVRIDNKGSSSSALSLASIVNKNDLPEGLSKTDKGFKLMANSDCFSCHQWAGKRIGPSFFEIAKRYKATEEKSTADLIGKIIKGGAGVWGPIPMMPHPQHNEKDVTEMVRTIFKLNKIKEH